MSKKIIQLAASETEKKLINARRSIDVATKLLLDNDRDPEDTPTIEELLAASKEASTIILTAGELIGDANAWIEAIKEL